MNTNEQEIEILKQYTAKEIILAMLESMDNYHGLPFLAYTRQRLEKCWNDSLWWPDKKMISTVKLLFKKLQSKQDRWTCGGSWSPEGTYYVDVYQCRLCSELIEINIGDEDEIRENPDMMNPTHGHMKRCTVARNIQDDSNNLEEFKIRLLRVAS